MARFNRRGVHGQMVEIIARRILCEEIREGETLDLAGLQAELEVSLTALREALKVLSAKGLVDARQKRGTFVRPRADWNLLDAEVIRWQLLDRHDKQMLGDVRELRMMIEPWAARLAARRASKEEVAALEHAVATMAGTDRDAVALEADLTFHRLLLSASGNELLKRLDAVIEADLTEGARPTVGLPASDEVRRHYAVFAAIRAHDAYGAERAIYDLFEVRESDLFRTAGADYPIRPAGS